MAKQETHPHGQVFARLVKGAGAMGFCQTVQVVIRLAEVPLFLGFWGPRLYGEWLMLFAIPSYLTLGNGGFSTAACHDMTMHGQTGDRQGVLAVFQSTWLLLSLISVAIGAFAVTFVSTAPLARWLGFSIIDERQVRIISILLTTYVLVGFQYGLLNGGYYVSGRYPLSLSLQGVNMVLEFALLALAVVLGYGPVGAAAGLLAGRLLGACLYWTCHRRVTPWLRHGISHASFAEVRRLFTPAMASLALPLGDGLNIQGTRLVIGLAIGPPAVAVFATMRTLARLAIQPANLISRLMEPEMSLAFGARNEDLFKKLFGKSCQAALWGSLAACLALLPVAVWVYPIWTAGRVTIYWPTFLILLAVSVVHGVWYTSLMAPFSTNRHGRIAIYYSITYGAAALAMLYMGAAWIGLSGAAMALLGAESAMAVIVIHASLGMTGTTVSRFLRNSVRPPISALRQFSPLLRVGAMGQRSERP